MVNHLFKIPGGVDDDVNRPGWLLRPNRELAVPQAEDCHVRTGLPHAVAVRHGKRR